MMQRVSLVDPDPRFNCIRQFNELRRSDSNCVIKKQFMIRISVDSTPTAMHIKSSSETCVEHMARQHRQQPNINFYRSYVAKKNIFDLSSLSRCPCASSTRLLWRDLGGENRKLKMQSHKGRAGDDVRELRRRCCASQRFSNPFRHLSPRQTLSRLTHELLICLITISSKHVCLESFDKHSMEDKRHPVNPSPYLITMSPLLTSCRLAALALLVPPNIAAIASRSRKPPRAENESICIWNEKRVGVDSRLLTRFFGGPLSWKFNCRFSSNFGRWKKQNKLMLTWRVAAERVICFGWSLSFQLDSSCWNFTSSWRVVKKSNWKEKSRKCWPLTGLDDLWTQKDYNFQARGRMRVLFVPLNRFLVLKFP